MAQQIVLNRRRQVPAEDTPAFGGIAERFRRAGDLDRAVALCQEGLLKFPDHLSARVTLGWSLLDLGRYEEAREALESALKRAPDNLAAIRGLAELHDRAEHTMLVPMDGAGQWSADQATIDSLHVDPSDDGMPAPAPADVPLQSDEALSLDTLLSKAASRGKKGKKKDQSARDAIADVVIEPLHDVATAPAADVPLAREEGTGLHLEALVAEVDGADAAAAAVDEDAVDLGNDIDLEKALQQAQAAAEQAAAESAAAKKAAEEQAAREAAKRKSAEEKAAAEAAARQAAEERAAAEEAARRKAEERAAAEADARRAAEEQAAAEAAANRATEKAAAEAAARHAAEEKAAAEAAARRAGEEKAAAEAATRKAAEEAARKAAEQKAAADAAAAAAAKKAAAEKKAAEEAAARRLNEEKAAAEAAAREAAERIAVEAKARKAAEERMAAETAARREAEKAAAETSRKAAEDRAAAEVAARKAAEERAAAEVAARRASEDMAAAEAAMRKVAQEVATESAARKVAEERAAAEASARAVAEAAAREAADRMALDTRPVLRLTNPTLNDFPDPYLEMRLAELTAFESRHAAGRWEVPLFMGLADMEAAPSDRRANGVAKTSGKSSRKRPPTHPALPELEAMLRRVQNRRTQLMSESVA